MQPPAPAQPHMAPPAASIFLTLPDELRLHIASAVREWQDRAALCLACPPLGVTAIRTIEAYKDPLLAVGIALWHRSPSSVLDEQCFRRYAADSQASDAGCYWLTARAEQHVVHYEGEKDAERMVRFVHPDGAVTHYEGEKGAERLVRGVHPDGRVCHFEGEKDAERRVRYVYPDGAVLHYEGEKGAERKVRYVYPDGVVFHFEGEMGVERAVRVVKPDGLVVHCEGEKDAERKVRVVHPDGRVVHYEGVQGAEQVVRVVLPDGTGTAE